VAFSKDKRDNRPAEFDWDDPEYVSISHFFSTADLMVD
jgi:hypothetical protein